MNLFIIIIFIIFISIYTFTYYISKKFSKNKFLRLFIFLVTSIYSHVLLLRTISNYYVEFWSVEIWRDGFYSIYGFSFYFLIFTTIFILIELFFYIFRVFFKEG